MLCLDKDCTYSSAKNSFHSKKRKRKKKDNIINHLCVKEWMQNDVNGKNRLHWTNWFNTENNYNKR